ncbi:MAG: universal stress protein [bacterium]|nr:universal stress protein [bacterium]
MSCLVLTTDLSEESQRAFAPAVALAEKLELPIQVVAVLEEITFEPVGGGMVAMPPDLETIRQDWQSELERVAATVKCQKGVKPVLLEAATVSQAIVEHAAAERASYVCMATHGRSGLRRLLLGSVAEQVIRHSNVPVIVYPPGAEAAASK